MGRKSDLWFSAILIWDIRKMCLDWNLWSELDMAGIMNKRIRHWCELEWNRNQVWILFLDLNWPAAWSLTHFISSFSFSASAFQLCLDDKPFGPGSLQVDVHVCVLLKNTLQFWCINYLDDFFVCFFSHCDRCCATRGRKDSLFSRGY